MAELISLPTYEDDRGALTVLEKKLPFSIKRLYWIHDLTPGEKRGGHRHKKTYQAMVCLKGKTKVLVKNAYGEQYYQLSDPQHCLLLAPEDWHEMDSFCENTLLLLMASEYYEAEDYVKEPQACMLSMKI